MSLTPKILSLAVMMTLAGTAAAANTDHPATGRALGLLQNNGAAVRAAANDQFIARDVIVDADGTEHVRFDRTYKGLPVIGGDFVTHARGGQLKGADLTLRTSSRPSLSARISADRAIDEAGAALGNRFDSIPTTSLVVFARNQSSPKLAYQVEFAGNGADGNGFDETFIVDANSGRLLDRWSKIQTASAAGTGRSLYVGNVGITTDSLSATSFQMVDPSRGSGSTYEANNVAYTTAAKRAKLFADADNTWGNNTNSDRATAAADAHYGVATTWDYYKNFLGRNGIFNNGVGAKSYVHTGRGWVNAAWYANAMYYGDGDGVTYGPLVDIDVAGHEMSHGVMQATANLTYSGESGGLNEANSDIQGAMVEFYANNASDPGDYLIGEKIYISGGGTKALRYMHDPIKDTLSPNCYTSTLGSLNVHYSSGVANHFFYLLSEGSGTKTIGGVVHTSTTCNGSTISGIGRDTAALIWYRATSVHMTSSTNYAGARTATLNAAASLYGNGSAQYNAVAAAWSAVSVN